MGKNQSRHILEKHWIVMQQLPPSLRPQGENVGSVGRRPCQVPGPRDVQWTGWMEKWEGKNADLEGQGDNPPTQRNNEKNSG